MSTSTIFINPKTKPRKSKSRKEMELTRQVVQWNSLVGVALMRKPLIFFAFIHKPSLCFSIEKKNKCYHSTIFNVIAKAPVLIELRNEIGIEETCLDSHVRWLCVGTQWLGFKVEVELSFILLVSILSRTSSFPVVLDFGSVVSCGFATYDLRFSRVFRCWTL